MNRLKRLVEDFLSFAAQLSEPQLETCDLNEVIHQVSSGYQELPTIQTQVQLDPNLPPVQIDPEKIRSVLHNLIKNAVEAMPQGGNLTIRTVYQSEQVMISIRDTGEGMSEETKQKFLTLGYTTKETGTGLGMVIVQQLIEGHNGNFEVESDLGVGTEMRVFLPIK